MIDTPATGSTIDPGLDAQFIDLVCTVDALVDAQFEAIVSAAWADAPSATEVAHRERHETVGARSHRALTTRIRAQWTDCIPRASERSPPQRTAISR